MNLSRAAITRLAIVSLLLSVAIPAASLAFQAPQETGRFDALAIPDPQAVIGMSAVSDSELPTAEAVVRDGWRAFRAAHGMDWEVWLDGRSGAPLLVQGPGIPWIPGTGNSLVGARPVTVDSLDASLRAFVTANPSTLVARNEELVLNREASGPLNAQTWQIVYDRRIDGIPVTGDRFIFYIGHGNLIAFGATRWSTITASSMPALDASEAESRLYAHMNVTAADRVELLEAGSLVFTPTLAPGTSPGLYAGRVGAGYGAALTWRFKVRIKGETGTWAALVDAGTGTVIGFYDDNKYAQVKGGVLPISNDSVCPSGCEQPAYPMPFANVTIGGVGTSADSAGVFDCQPGGAAATTSLSGPYVRVVDTCGSYSQTVMCDSDIDFGVNSGTDCTVPAGASGGDTRSSRSGFYHLNRIMEHGRTWLPGNGWLDSQVTDNVNIPSTCNAYWDGASVNFYKSGGGCRNTGEIAAVFLHEWGHGLDQNDGGGYDNPSEAYADITGFLSTHISCMGRGFFQSRNCGGYGNACLSCTGVREMDYMKRARRQPSTPQNFTGTNCSVSSGGGPCGREVHCEAYPPGEAVWDIAARDLPTAGYDSTTSWEILDRLWYTSRFGSGGDAFNCALPSSDGCAAQTWFTRMRVVDDDDGNLANGTPHAGAIFSAFARHNIACGAAGDPSNQSRGMCPNIAAPELIATSLSGSAKLDWKAVGKATSYRILRNDAGCSAGFTIVGKTSGTSYVDSGLADGYTQYYTVQAISMNDACDGLVSNCVAATPEPYAGSVTTDRDVYACSSTIRIIVRDANIAGPTTTATIRSTSEPVPETVVLTQVAPGSYRYEGTIQTTSAPPAGDGLLSLTGGDTVTVGYLDADDGQGNTNVPRQHLAGADCLGPEISGVQATDVTGTEATIGWTTNEASNTTVRYGTTPAPASSASDASLVTAHSKKVTGLSICTPYYYRAESTDFAGNTAIDDNGGNWYTFTTGQDTQPSWNSKDTPVNIPDNNPTGVFSTITVPDNLNVVHVSATVTVTHTYTGDLVLYLIAPTGRTITLANRRGTGANFTNTTFDDDAATPISEGAVPFTGTFKPDSPLSVLNGINAQGDWKFKVADVDAYDSGQITSWTLHLKFPPRPCGPVAQLAGWSKVQDSCPAGGSGSGNGTWDPGEEMQFSVSVQNLGSVDLTGVSATVTPTTPGVVMITPTASYGTIPVNTTAVSQAPHFLARVPAEAVCGSSVEFQVTINANEGTFGGGFSTIVGQPYTGPQLAISEDFSGGIPSSWTVVDGGHGGGDAATWTTANPGHRAIRAPLTAPVVIVDSGFANSDAIQDEQLVTPVLDMSAALGATIDFDEYFNTLGDAAGDVDVKSSLTGGIWTTVLRNMNATTPNPNHRTVNITAQAAGASDVQIRFHYYSYGVDWWWMVDNVRVTASVPAGCNAAVCQPTVMNDPDVTPPERLPGHHAGAPARKGVRAAPRVRAQ